VIQNNIPSFNLITNIGHRCLFDHINLESLEIYIGKNNPKTNLHIILEDDGSGYASGDIAQVIVKYLFRT
jgi:hypothetical protein